MANRIANIKYMNGSEERIETETIKIVDTVKLKLKTGIRVEPSKCPYLEIKDVEGRWNWIPFQSIQRMEFDTGESEQ